MVVLRWFPMRILLTNDDGYTAEGLQTLEQVLTAKGHEVWVVAPNGQRSGRSHAITVHSKLYLQQVKPRHYLFDGTPADCVFFANYGMLEIPKPYVVISGINKGYNIAKDVMYSGTLGAASEGNCCGLKAIAVSCDEDENGKFVYQDAANFVAENLDMLLSVCDETCFVNVNVPPHANGKWQPVDIADVEYYGNYTHLTEDGYYSMEGKPNPESVKNPPKGSDFYSVYVENIIAINVINKLPSLNDKMMAKLRELT